MSQTRAKLYGFYDIHINKTCKSLDGCTGSPDGPRELGVVRINQKFSVDIENDIISRRKLIS